MRVLWNVLGDRKQASSRVRGYWIAEALEEHGVTSEFILTRTRGSFITLFFRLLCFDVVVFQKQYTRWHVLIAKWARILGKTVVFDIDDAPSRTNNKKTLENVAKMISGSSLVLAGCDKLVEFTSQYNSNVLLVPSTVKLENYESSDRVVSDDGVFTLGWIGNGAHYRDDLVQILAEPLRRLAQLYPLRLKIVGACGVEQLREVFSAIDGLEVDLIDQIDWASPTATRDAMQGVDVGLYPLLENNFNPYKCGFKALEYMALGIPVIVTPVSVSADIVRDGVDGYICASDDAWVQAIESLVKDVALRKKMGEYGMEQVKAHYSTKGVASVLAEKFKRGL